MSLRFKWRAVVGAVIGLGLAAAAGVDTASAKSAPQAEICDREPGVFTDAAQANGINLYAMQWAPFGPAEMGWETYAPLIQKELGTGCDPSSPAFAEKLSVFQTLHNVPATGQLDVATFTVFRGLWQERRPFILARIRGECPNPPPISELAYLTAGEEHAERMTRMARRDVLEAYRAMVAAARAEVPEIAQQPELLQIFSSFREPEADAARCARDGNCDGVRRASCSAHRTGTALDIYVGHLLGYGVDSTHTHNRRYMSQTPTYRWLVRNAERFGFVPYAFEPWHWEWVGPPQGYAQ
ncbi:D-alanyl-D-alanine carboxypeptidase family protein [Brevundimonas sp. UBA5866]|uniref:D-alanyl-D-alanine carboxypeptidase family protein n=1 Tax=Brevundimonas sp. UBA5866 TaxID=1946132 RepID=UPI0025BB1F0F|nr:D-alanyl-D-alanine carboxypeptidase family protein [Brevundimonas sp. UBA5866]